MANSSVSSIGKPNVSYNLKAKSLSIVLTFCVSFSNTLKPFSNVLLNLDFSLASSVIINSLLLDNSS